MDERGETDGNHDQATPQKEEIRDKRAEIPGAPPPLLARSDAAVTRLIRRGEQLNFLGLRRHRRIAPTEADICGNLKRFPAQRRRELLSLAHEVLRADTG